MDLSTESIMRQLHILYAQLGFGYDELKGYYVASTLFEQVGEYSCAVTPQIRQTGNRLSGNAGTAYASLLA